MIKSEARTANQLIKESSPYLLQHANNPVNWLPWNEETLKLANKENKLIIISIGYSACHWCHVMGHESFEDEEVAKIMNANFICIKVDREERPDVDQIYMDAVQMINGKAGWPLNCFALPDGKPFWGGTYFPKEQWIGILKNVIQIYNTQKPKIIRQADDLTKGLGGNVFLNKTETGADFGKDEAVEIVDAFSFRFDSKNGGLKGAPKFPLPNNLLFLLRYSNRAKKQEIADFAELSLEKMASGGIYDHLAGGFARYSVDDHWHVPHFEKMLYDNAQLVSLYSEAFRLSKKESYKKVIEETLKFIELEMTSPEGGYYSSIDADSEDEEGKYYVWNKEEIERITKENAGITIDYFGIDKEAYWEDGENVLVKAASFPQIARKYNKTVDEITDIVAKAKKVLLKKRLERVRPGLDDKILTSWNALMIKGYIDAYNSTWEPAYLENAKKNTGFLLRNLKMSDGGLFHNYKNGKASIEGFLEDYAFMIEALIALYQITFEEKWIVEAKLFLDYALTHFYDDQSGLFYFTSDKSNDLIARKIEVTDNVIPSSNSSFANSLFILGLLYHNTEYQKMAERMLSQVVDKLIKYPSAFSNWGNLYLNLAYPFYTVVFTGENSKLMAGEFSFSYHSNIVKAGSKEKSELPIFRNRFVKNKTMIYVCKGNECKLPVETIDEAVKQLDFLNQSVNLKQTD